MGFSAKYKGGFSYGVVRRQALTWTTFKKRIKRLIEIIDNYTLENLDSLECIKKYDSNNTFFFVDPPYPNADQGHYKGYNQEDFENLLNVLGSVKGRFILTCYRNNLPDELPSFFKNHKCIVKKIVASKESRDKQETEFIGWNFNIQTDLFFNEHGCFIE